VNPASQNGLDWPSVQAEAHTTAYVKTGLLNATSGQNVVVSFCVSNCLKKPKPLNAAAGLYTNATGPSWSMLRENLKNEVR
jgi:hypothetical protein